jgi:hypothetical protein
MLLHTNMVAMSTSISRYRERTDMCIISGMGAVARLRDAGMAP